jgi:DNA-binding MarR family transcriptional regulator
MSSNLPAVPRAWVRLLRAHAELSRRMDASLRAAHGMSLREYEVLLALSDAPVGRLRRVDLAAKVLLTQGGVTRVLDPLERAGLVSRVASEQDRRVAYAELTPAGRRRLTAAGRTHRRDIEELFGGRFDAGELATLDSLLARLPGAAGESDWAT